MNPTCLLINLSDTCMDWMLGVILKTQNFKSTDSPIVWSVATKYYNAKVDLHQVPVQKVVDGKDEQVKEVIDNCEAVIFYLGLKTNLDEAAAAWVEIQKSAEPGVCLMVVDSAVEPSRTKLLGWCLENQFELVECDEDVEEEEEEDAIKECTGKERVGEALEAHTWSNLELVEENEGAGGGMEEKQDAPEKRVALEPNIDAEIDALLDGNNGENGEDANFEDLFAQFASIRDKSSNLNPEERKAYAEKVAIAFWKSMGGSDDEIDGLDDLSD